MEAPTIQFQAVIDNLADEISRLAKDNAVLRATVAAYQNAQPLRAVPEPEEDKTG